MSGSSPSPSADPRDQPERTSLAWTRTLTGMLAASLLLIRWLTTAGVVVLPLLLLTISSAFGILATQRTRLRRDWRGLARRSVPAEVGSVVLLTATVLALGLGGVGIILTQ